jgi:S-adenosylmethionine synthetase
MARHITKNIITANLTDKCLIQLSYTIGIAEPTSIYIDYYGTQSIDLNKITPKSKIYFQQNLET